MADIQKNTEARMLIELDVENDHFSFASSIETAMLSAEHEYQHIDKQLSESLNTLKKLTTECDKLDYVLSATCGALCGIIDIFLVGTPKGSPVGAITDKWFGERTKDFAKMCGWKDKGKGLASAIGYLERTFKVPYDDNGLMDAARDVFDLNPKNHHFKSLAHNPTLLGFFFAILDQFNNQFHFVSDGKLIVEDKNGTFELLGNDAPSKFFCAFVNWFGHLISDMSGSSGSKSRGMGIPSPFWTWTNDIIAIKSKLNISVSEFDKSINELALNIYNEGYDTRFQSTQAISVFVNELLVRLIYSVRRMLRYFCIVKKDERSFKQLWNECEPFSNGTVKRMLTVAHGTFCLIDMGDSVIRGFAAGGGGFNVVEFTMHLNIVGVGRFSFSLYGEINRGVKKKQQQENVYFLKREKIIIEDYINGLKDLSYKYDDKDLLTFVDDLKNSDMYNSAFMKSAELAKKRNVPDNEILKSKGDIDRIFRGDDPSCLIKRVLSLSWLKKQHRTQ